MGCPYCFANKTGLETPRENIAPLIERMPLLGVQKVDISGGEPLCYPHLAEICQAVLQKRLFLTLTTSGVGSERNKRWIIDNTQSLSRLIVSLDGSSAEMHDTLRATNGAWSHAHSIIRAVQPEVRRRLLRLNTVVTPVLALDFSELARLVSHVLEIGVVEWCLIEPHPANAKPRFDEYRLSSSLFDDVVHFVRGMTSAASISIITRSRSLYSEYWCLQPSGELRQHSTGQSDRKGVDLLQMDPGSIAAFLAQTTTTIPTDEKANTDRTSESQ